MAHLIMLTQIFAYLVRSLTLLQNKIMCKITRDFTNLDFIYLIDTMTHCFKPLFDVVLL